MAGNSLQQRRLAQSAGNPMHWLCVFAGATGANQQDIIGVMCPGQVLVQLGDERLICPAEHAVIQSAGFPGASLPSRTQLCVPCKRCLRSYSHNAAR